MKYPVLLSGACVVALLCCGQAVAQSTTRPVARIITSCGTPPYTYTVGNSEQILQDTTGKLCDTGSGGSGGGNAAAGPTGSAVPSSASYNAVSVGGTLTGQTGTTGGNANVNISQINGSTPLMGNGNSAGALRTVPSQDANANANFGQGATGSAAPSGATQAGAQSSGTMVAIIQADKSAAIAISTATTTSLVAAVSSKKIYVTHWDVLAAGTGNIQLEYGTQVTNPCDTGTTVLTGNYNLVAQAGISAGDGLSPILVIPASDQLCAVTSAAVGMAGAVSYTQQ